MNLNPNAYSLGVVTVVLPGGPVGTGSLQWLLLRAQEQCSPVEWLGWLTCPARVTRSLRLAAVAVA